MITHKYCLRMLNKAIIYTSLLASGVVVGVRSSDVPRSIVDAVQGLKPSKSFILQYEIDQVPVESGVYFQSIVNGYSARVKRDVIAQLRQSVIQGDRNSKESLYLFEQLPTTKTVKQAMALLTRAISAHKTMVVQNVGHQDMIDRNDRVYAAILLQNSVVLTNNARDKFLTILDEINNSLMYWRDQKNHPTKYFFHKSPIKWVMGKNQVKEVADNIKKLEKLEHSMRDVLGKMIKHLYAFNPNISVDETYGWVEQLLSIVSCIGTYDDKAADSTRFDQLAQKLRFYIGRVGNFKNVTMAKVASAKKPSHLVRNWMAYTAAIVAGYQAYNFYTNPKVYQLESNDGLRGMTNAEWITDLIGLDALKGYASDIQGYAQTKVIDPLIDTGSAIFVSGSRVAEDENIKLHRKELKDVLAKLKEEVPGWIWGTLGGKLEEGKTLSDIEVQYILQEEEKGNTTPLLELLYNMKKNKTALASSVDEIIQLGLIYVNLVAYHGVKSQSDELRVVKNLAILAPTLLASWFAAGGLGKFYNWFTARDYSSVRLALIAINSLFIEARAPLNDSDYGKLIYLLQGLKVKAMRYLPTQNNVRDDFLSDIAKLESQQFTVETKRRIIKNMFNKYQFLSLKEKTA